jgi:hypothetical protein
VMKEEQIAPQIESGYLEIIGNCSISYALQWIAEAGGIR